MDNIERLEELIQSKHWKDLTLEEKEFVIRELGSEFAFNAMQQTDKSLSKNIDNISPHWNILPELRTRFRHKHQSGSVFNRLFSFPVPAYAMVVTILLIAFGGWFFGKEQTSVQVAIEPTILRDTVYLTSLADTVYITKVVYRNIYRTEQPSIISVVSRSSMVVDSVGVTMKDKEELDNLLVSGSE